MAADGAETCRSIRMPQSRQRPRRQRRHLRETPDDWHRKGVAGGTIREYSDILAIFLLKGLRPDRYQERVGMEVRGTLAHLDLNRLPDHLLQRIADGEHPYAVIASAVPVGADGTPDLAALPLLPSGGEPRAGEIVVEEERGERGDAAT